MAFKQEDRYATAGALARDVERWLDDEPVDAYPEPWPAPAGRWLRRHRAVAVGAATALVSAVVGLTALNVQTSRANTVIAEARTQAETNFALAVDVVRNLLTDVARSELPKIPGAEALRRSVAEKSTVSLEALQAQRSDDPKVLASASGAYRELGNIRRLYGDDDASASYRRAIELLEKAMRLEPSNPVHRDRLAELLIDAAEAERKRGRPAAAEPLYREAIRIAASLADEFPDEPDYRRTKARTSYNLADLYVEAGDFPGAIRLLEEAVGIMKPFADSDRPGPTDRIEVVLVLVSLRTSLNGRDGSEDAAETLREAARRAESLLKVSADDPDARFLRALAQHQLGRAIFPSQPDHAIEQFDHAVREARRLTREFSESEPYHLAEADALEARGARSLTRSRPDDALAHLNAARGKLATLLEKSPKHPTYSGLQGRVLGALGRVSLDRGDAEEARKLFVEAVELQGIALRANPENPIDRQALIQHEEALRRLGSQDVGEPAP